MSVIRVKKGSKSKTKKISYASSKRVKKSAVEAIKKYSHAIKALAHR